MPTKIKLTTKQKEFLIQLKRKTKSNLIRDRAHAVLLRNEDFTIANTAKALLRSSQFVKDAVSRYRKGELDQLNSVGNNNNGKLSRIERCEIIKIIRTKSPKELKGFNFTTQFWSTDILAQFIKKEYNVEYKCYQSYHNLFKQAGFSFKKPKTKDFRQDPEKIKQWKGALKKSSSITRIRLSW